MQIVIYGYLIIYSKDKLCNGDKVAICRFSWDTETHIDYDLPSEAWWLYKDLTVDKQRADFLWYNKLLRKCLYDCVYICIEKRNVDMETGYDYKEGRLQNTTQKQVAKEHKTNQNLHNCCAVIPLSKVRGGGCTHKHI